MSVSKYDMRVDTEVTFIRGGNIAELAEALVEVVKDPDATWHVEDGAIVLEVPMGSLLTPSARQ